MNKTEKIVIGLIILGLFLTVLMVMNLGSLKVNVGGMSQTVGSFSSLENTGVTTGILVTTASTQVIATSSAREYAEISNLTASAIYCNANADKPAVMYQGVVIMASSSKVFGQDFAYKGAIQCIASGNASTTVYSKQ